MNSIRKRDYDADLERLKTFIDSYHNNDPETGKKGMILNVNFALLMHFLRCLQRKLHTGLQTKEFFFKFVRYCTFRTGIGALIKIKFSREKQYARTYPKKCNFLMNLKQTSLD